MLGALAACSDSSEELATPEDAAIRIEIKSSDVKFYMEWCVLWKLRQVVYNTKRRLRSWPQCQCKHIFGTFRHRRNTSCILQSV